MNIGLINTITDSGNRMYVCLHVFVFVYKIIYFYEDLSIIQVDVTMLQ